MDSLGKDALIILSILFFVVWAVVLPAIAGWRANQDRRRRLAGYVSLLEETKNRREEKQHANEKAKRLDQSQ